MSLTVHPTLSPVDPAVERWLEQPIPALCCDLCGRLTADYIVDDMPVPQEGGTALVVIGRCCQGGDDG